MMKSDTYETPQKWIGPLFTNAGGWEAYVSYHNGTWYVGRENPLIIGEGKSGMLLLPILQEGYGENYDTQISILKSGLSIHSQDPDIAYSFPFYVPILFAFKHMSGWVPMTINWIEKIELTYDRAQILFDYCQKKLGDQSTRHQILKIVNRWAKQEGVTFIRKSDDAGIKR